MTHPDAVRWNERYTVNARSWLQSRPSQLLLDFIPRLPPAGLALVAAAGAGSNSLVLARHGLQVIALDISPAGLALARHRFAKEGLELAAAVYDLAQPWFPPHSFDVIVNFRFLERATFTAYRHALRPGGWLIFETFVQGEDSQGKDETEISASERPAAPAPTPPSAYYLKPGELAAAFADWQIVLSQQRSIMRHGRVHKTTDQLVARKPT